MTNNDFLSKDLTEIIALSKIIGSQHYHRLSTEDFEEYCRYNKWRHVNGDTELETTQESRAWVSDNSDQNCPICGCRYSKHNGRSIDHKLPRSKYPWLSMDFRNLWVICRSCNMEKLDMDWYEYELYMMNKHPDYYEDVKFMRPRTLLKELKSS